MARAVPYSLIVTLGEIRICNQGLAGVLVCGVYPCINGTAAIQRRVKIEQNRRNASKATHRLSFAQSPTV